MGGGGWAHADCRWKVATEPAHHTGAIIEARVWLTVVSVDGTVLSLIAFHTLTRVVIELVLHGTEGIIYCRY